MGPPYICPLCNGSGRGRSVVTSPDTVTPTTTVPIADYMPCHACSGKGIVWPPTPMDPPPGNPWKVICGVGNGYTSPMVT